MVWRGSTIVAYIQKEIKNTITFSVRIATWIWLDLLEIEKDWVDSYRLNCFNLLISNNKVIFCHPDYLPLSPLQDEHGPQGNARPDSFFREIVLIQFSMKNPEWESSLWILQIKMESNIKYHFNRVYLSNYRETSVAECIVTKKFTRAENLIHSMTSQSWQNSTFCIEAQTNLCKTTKYLKGNRQRVWISFWIELICMQDKTGRRLCENN